MCVVVIFYQQSKMRKDNSILFQFKTAQQKLTFIKDQIPIARRRYILKMIFFEIFIVFRITIGRRICKS